jgi:nicotinamide-nucleotide amidase
VGDDRSDIVRVLRETATRADAVVVTGGLGPTSDDLTAAAAAEAFGRDVVRVAEALEHVQRFFASRGREMSPNNAKQADLPDGSTILPNPLGTAVGFRLDAARCRLYFLPGVPQELEGMVAGSVLPDLEERISSRPVLLATLKVFGRGESDVAQALDGLERALPDGCRLVIQYRATFPEIHVRLVLAGAAADESTVERLLADARERIGRHVFAAAVGDVETGLPDAVAADLGAAGATVALAEGCSAGEASALLAAAVGGPAVLAGSVVVTDRTRAASILTRQELLSCDWPSAAAAEILAAGVRSAYGATWGAATLGVAGDGAPRGDARPGQLWVGVAGADGTRHRALRFPVEGARFRRLAAYVALGMVARAMAGGET